MDIISRKAVIDGIEELKKSPWANDNRNGYGYLIPEALETVRDLCVKDCPSAFEGMTNGEVMKAILPDIEVTINKFLGSVVIGGAFGRFVTTLDWWLDSYKGVSE